MRARGRGLSVSEAVKGSGSESKGHPERAMPEWLKALPLGLGVPVVIAAASVKPEDAASNLAAWAHLLGFEHVPDWLLNPSVYQSVKVGALAAVAIYALAVWPIPKLRKRHRDTPSLESKLKYLSQRDSDLGPAIISMALHSAWGRWYAARHLVNLTIPVRHEHLYQVAANEVMEEITNGNLEVRGRRSDPRQLGYELIDRTHWRSSSLMCVRDSFAIWKIILVPKGGVEVDQGGDIVRSDNAVATQRTSLLDYDSLSVDAYQFERLWPAQEKLTDRKRRRLLCKARWLRLDKAEIRRLS
jgi:hypothetical protein